MKQRDFLYKSSKIIDRMGTNHFRGYITLISITGLSIPINSLIINVNDFTIRVLLSSFLILIIGCLSGVSFYNSKRYLKMERCYIESEKEGVQKTIENNSVLEDKNISELFNGKKYEKDMKIKRKGFVFFSSLGLFIINLILPSVILVVSFFI